MTYKKENQTFTSGSIIVGDVRIFNPSHEQLIAAGWSVYTPPTLPARPKRYSKLKLYDAMGATTWASVIASLTDAQKTRLELANELSMADADFAAALNAIAATVPNADTILAEAEI
jgi:hypothetical protein